MLKQTLNIKGELVDLSEKPLIMGIVNLTPDSFYASSRCDFKDVEHRLQTIIEEGGDLIDLGAYSTRPNAEPVSYEIERKRLEPVLAFIQKEMPKLRLSVDTFRSDIARMSVEEYGVSIINDVSGGTLDEQMFATVSQLQVPYVLMHMRGNPQTMQSLTDYDDLVFDITKYLMQKVDELHELGLHDVILDLGFGFGKTLEQNYELLSAISEIQNIIGEPMLVGISRKSMIYQAINSSPEYALNGTTVLHTFALSQGANILRVHDVKEAVECRELMSLIPKKESLHVERFLREKN